MNATDTDEVGSGCRVVRLPENPGYGTICRVLHEVNLDGEVIA